VRNCGDSADFFSGITIEVNQENLPRFLGVQDLHEGGNIMCVQHTENYLTNIEKDVFSHSGPMLESQLRRGFFFISETVKQGYSGAPVFSDMSSENPKFLGLVQGNLINNKTIVENLGIVTDGGDIFNGLIDYFDNLKD
jgi:hypothetical protein